ncbi:MAG: isochorismatase family protein [Burkholderiales bacterium]|jgi:nicotinamidase-related amidase|nr:isochorismatase family protein [Burkholderiales bacterium]
MAADADVQALDADRSVLLLVDWQTRLLPAIDQGALRYARAVRLAAIAAAVHVPCLGTEQSPDKLGPNGPEIRDACARTFTKTHFDATQADAVAAAVRQHVEAGRSQWVLAGCETHVCLLQTVLGLLRMGVEVRVVIDACGSRDAADRDAALDRLGRAGAGLVTSEMVGFEWVRHAGHPAFRTWQGLIRSR